MFADLGRHMPQEFDDRYQCLEWLRDKQLGIRRSINLLAKDDDALTVRVPITNENIVIYGDNEEIRWLHLAMVRNQMYTI